MPDNAQELPVYPAYHKTTLGFAEVSSFDVYADGNTLHVLASGSDTSNTGLRQLRYLRSSDGGRHWSQPLPVNTQTPVAATNKPGNDVQIAARGNHLLALWQTAGELPGMGLLATSYSDDGGKTWQMGNSPAGADNHDQAHADMAVDANGVFHTVWLADPEENGYQSLQYARSHDSGHSWTKAKTLDDSTCSCCWNVLTVTGTGELDLLYRDMEPRDMALLQSKDQGDNWKQVNHVGDFHWKFDGCPHIGGGLSVSGANLDSVVWTGEEQHQGLYYLHSNDNGLRWSPPFKLGNNPLHGSVARTRQNQIIAVWDEREPNGLGVFMSKSADNGKTWSVAERVSASSSNAMHPRIIATAKGAVIMWTQKQDKQASQWAFTLIENE